MLLSRLMLPSFFCRQHVCEGIIRQECIHEGKHCYTVIKVRFRGGKIPHTPEDEFLGKLDLSNEENRLFLIKEIKKAEKRSIGDPSVIPVVEKLKEKLK